MKHVDNDFLMLRPPIVLTSRDHERLTGLLRDWSPLPDPEVVRFLREELDRADIAPDEATGMMVGMGCEVKFIDDTGHRLRSGRLVYPHEVGSGNPHEVENGDCISVLSPTGSALIGLGPGQSICWDQRGVERKVTVLEVRACAGAGAPELSAI